MIGQISQNLLLSGKAPFPHCTSLLLSFPQRMEEEMSMPVFHVFMCVSFCAIRMDAKGRAGMGMKMERVFL